MEAHVIIEKIVSQAIGAMGLPREILIGLLSTLHDDLTNRYGELRGRREPDDPDYFRYKVTLPATAEAQWHIFYFRVNDTRAQGYLFVETVDYQPPG